MAFHSFMHTVRWSPPTKCYFLVIWWSHIFPKKNIKPQCVLISIYQINPGNKRFLKSVFTVHIKLLYVSWGGGGGNKSLVHKHLQSLTMQRASYPLSSSKCQDFWQNVDLHNLTQFNDIIFIGIKSSR